MHRPASLAILWGKIHPGKEFVMSYTAKDFSYLLGMKGFSDTLLKNHFTLYQGYVTNTNKVLDLLAACCKEGKEALLNLPN